MLNILIQLNVGQGEFHDRNIISTLLWFIGMISDGIIISDSQYSVISTYNYYV